MVRRRIEAASQPLEGRPGVSESHIVLNSATFQTDGRYKIGQYSPALLPSSRPTPMAAHLSEYRNCFASSGRRTLQGCSPGPGCRVAYRILWHITRRGSKFLDVSIADYNADNGVMSHEGIVPSYVRIEAVSSNTRQKPLFIKSWVEYNTDNLVFSLSVITQEMHVIEGNNPKMTFVSWRAAQPTPPHGPAFAEI
ncbi:hypothetical protein M8818_004576 [Zalaria obscura]|uniref:Uncharacterized protein n=1 Tax=Zalaria obscura TaxID=2024903 RepID=A0ACC3SC08_9PEZI